jgi:hypothetical protein
VVVVEQVSKVKEGCGVNDGCADGRLASGTRGRRLNPARLRAKIATRHTAPPHLCATPHIRSLRPQNFGIYSRVNATTQKIRERLCNPFRQVNYIEEYFLEDVALFYLACCGVNQVEAVPLEFLGSQWEAL